MPKITDFVSSFKTDVARPCNYSVIIVPTNVTLLASFPLSDLTLRCESTELPARTFGLINQKTYGPIQKFPVQNAYDNINLTFICSDSMVERSIFDSWMEIISQANPSLITAVGLSDRYNFDFEYKDNYAATIILNQQKVDHQSSYTIQLIEAFPISINPMQLSWQNSNEYHRLVVTFAYRYYNYYPI